VYSLDCIDGTLAHHWEIEPSNGKYSTGTCKKCNEIKKFSNSVGALTSWKTAGEAFQQKQQLTNLGDKDKSSD